MKSKMLAFVVLTIALAACGGAEVASDEPTTTEAPVTTAVPTTTVAPTTTTTQGTTTTQPTTTTTTQPTTTTIAPEATTSLATREEALDSDAAIQDFAVALGDALGADFSSWDSSVKQELHDYSKGLATELDDTILQLLDDPIAQLEEVECDTIEFMTEVYAQRLVRQLDHLTLDQGIRWVAFASGWFSPDGKYSMAIRPCG